MGDSGIGLCVACPVERAIQQWGSGRGLLKEGTEKDEEFWGIQTLTPVIPEAQTHPYLGLAG